MKMDMTKKGVGEIAKIVPRIAVSTPCPGVTLHTVRTGVRDLVNLLVSMPGGTGHEENHMLVRVFTEMLLEGTKKRSRAQFHEALEARGIELSFHADYGWLTCSIRMLKNELPTALALAVEALTSPALDAAALAIVKERLVTSLQHAKSDTRGRARTLLAQKMYPRGHKNWSPSEDESIRAVQAVTRADLVALSKKYGVGEMLAVATGDVRSAEMGDMLAHVLRPVRASAFGLLREPLGALPRKQSVDELSIAGKASIDVFLGQSLQLRYDDPDYYALALAMSVLGEGFTGRLMARVRARDGLTYHTTARAGGFSGGASGYWFAYGSFAPELYARGVDALQREVSEFVARGITEEELDHRKTMLAGEHQVGLSTARALASTILSLLEDGRPLSIIDEYPDKFASLTRDEVNAVIEKHLDVRALALVAAGTIQKGN